MKKNILNIIALSLLLTACGNEEVEKDVKVICPTGAPSVAFYNHYDDPNFETNSVPSNIVSFMSETSPYDVVIIDTVSGLKAIAKGAPYKIHSSITFGNFFIASTGHDENGVMEPGDKIVLFGKNQTPDLVFHNIYGDDYDSSIEYVTAVSDAAGCLASGKNVATGSDIDYVFVAQPVLFATLNNANAPTHGKASVYANIQNLYKDKNDNNELIQASVFVKNGSNCEAFLSSLKEDINNVVTNPNLISEKLGDKEDDVVKAKYGIGANVMKAVLNNGNGLGLGFKEAKTNKTAINKFISLFGLEVISDDVIA